MPIHVKNAICGSDASQGVPSTTPVGVGIAAAGGGGIGRQLSRCFAVASDLDVWLPWQYIAATCSRPAQTRISGAALEIPEQSSPVSGSSFQS
jgi:hypothetical protein